jgi:nicotinate-nucleotide--dimethylbenzimidazole phosphoribosyltransferase
MGEGEPPRTAWRVGRSDQADSAEEAVLAVAASIPEPDRGAMERAAQRQGDLIKPAGSLGRLEEIAIQIAGMTGLDRPRADRKVAIVFAADHGVTAEGVSAYPSAVTAQMVRSFVAGSAAVSVLARKAGAEVVVVDVGVAAPLAADLPIEHRKVHWGTASITAGPAMTRAETVAAMGHGMAVVEGRLTSGLDLLALGEMGIGNTTAAAAVAAALLGLDPEFVAGRGTGLDAAGMARKIAAIRRGLEINQPDPCDPIGVLAAVGGLEIAALAGAMLRAAAARVPIILDGFIAGSAALAAARIAPSLIPYLIAAHRSPETGHGPILAALGLHPLVDLNMRLGEASGALLGMSIVDAALTLHNQMGTFDEAGVSGPTDTSPMDLPQR